MAESTTNSFDPVRGAPTSVAVETFNGDSFPRIQPFKLTREKVKIRK